MKRKIVVATLLIVLAAYTVVADWISSDRSSTYWVFGLCLAGLAILSVWTVRNIHTESAKVVLAVYTVAALLVALAALAAASYTRAIAITAATVVIVAIMADERGRAWLNRMVGDGRGTG